MQHAMQTQKKYKIINTTVKAAKRHPETGEDQRSAVERVGHTVSFKGDDGQVVMVTQTQPRIVNNLSEGVLRLARGRFIRIEEIDDVVTALRQHTLQPKASPRDIEAAADGQAELFAPDQDAGSAEVSHPSARRKVNVAEMGAASPQDIEAAVNPDGEPNFTVTATRNMKRERRAKRG